MNTFAEKEVEHAKLVAPSLGAEWQGGIYAGIERGLDGQADMHIIAAPLACHQHDLNWQEGIDAADKVDIGGFTDWEPMSSRDARLASVNIPENFRQDVFYWTSTQHPSGSDCAYVQGFADGYTDYGLKSYQWSVAFVRRISVI